MHLFLAPTDLVGMLPLPVYSVIRYFTGINLAAMKKILLLHTKWSVYYE